MRPTISNPQAKSLDRKLALFGAIIIAGAVAWKLTKPSEPVKSFQSKPPITDTIKP